MILTQLPDLPPRPETAANAAFRRAFYARWGRENAIVCGCAARAEYSAWTQSLSIKMASGGGERYLLPQRELRVDDDSLLILNQGRRYGSRLEPGPRPAESFAVFFRPGLLAQVRAARQQTPAALLDRPDSEARDDFEFGEHLRPRGTRLAWQLAQLRTEVLAGERSEDWLEQHLLLAQGERDREAVAQRCGFGSSWAMQRALQRFAQDPHTVR